jgi:4-hydroxy-tetrahydrodipicolinate synthase
MKLTSNASGVFPIAPTPFFEDGKIDTSSIDRLADFYLSCGTSGLTVLGLMGEAPKLTHAESVAVAAQFVKKTPHLPVVVGVTAPGFASMRMLAQEVMSLGAAGVMIAPPNSLRTDEQIINYYKDASKSIGEDIPIVLQDFPISFLVQMSPKVIRDLVGEVSAIQVLKHEDWPGLEKISALRSYEKDGSMRHLAIMCGNGGLFLDFEMSRGADGSNTGYCFPEMLCDLIRLKKENAQDEAHDLFDAHLPLLRYEQQPGVGMAIRKYILFKRGLISTDAQRSPGGKLKATAIQEVDFLLRRLAKRDPRARVG